VFDDGAKVIPRCFAVLLQLQQPLFQLIPVNLHASTSSNNSSEDTTKDLTLKAKDTTLEAKDMLRNIGKHPPRGLYAALLRLIVKRDFQAAS